MQLKPYINPDPVCQEYEMQNFLHGIKMPRDMTRDDVKHHKHLMTECSKRIKSAKDPMDVANDLIRAMPDSVDVKGLYHQIYGLEDPRFHEHEQYRKHIAVTRINIDRTTMNINLVAYSMQFGVHEGKRNELIHNERKKHDEKIFDITGIKAPKKKATSPLFQFSKNGVT